MSKDGVEWSRIRPVSVSAPDGRQAAEQCFSWGSGSCSPSLQTLLHSLLCAPCLSAPDLLLQGFGYTR